MMQATGCIPIRAPQATRTAVATNRLRASVATCLLRGESEVARCCLLWSSQYVRATTRRWRDWIDLRSTRNPVRCCELHRESAPRAVAEVLLPGVESSFFFPNHRARSNGHSLDALGAIRNSHLACGLPTAQHSAASRLGERHAVSRVLL